MQNTPDGLVRSFLAALTAKDIDTAATMVSDDFEYDNVPSGKTFGPDGLHRTLSGFFAMAEQLDWEVLRQTSSGDMTHGTVLNERDDRVLMKGQWWSLPVAGIFEVRDGRITLWRDYFDQPTLMKILTAGA